MRPMLFAATAALLLMSAAGAHARDQISWAPSFDAGQRMAAAQGKLLLVHFYSDSCGPCRGVDAKVFSQSYVGDELAKNFVCVKVNTEVQPAIAKRYKIERIPTDVVVTPSGHVVHTSGSSQDPADYLAEMNQAAAKAKLTLPVQTQVADQTAQPGRPGQPGQPGLPQISYGTPPAREAQPAAYNDPNGANGAPAPNYQAPPAGPAGYDPYRGGNLGGAPPAGNLGGGNLGGLPAGNYGSGNLGAPPAGNYGAPAGNLGGAPPAGNLGGYSGQYDNLPPSYDPNLAGGGQGPQPMGLAQVPPPGSRAPAYGAPNQPAGPGMAQGPGQPPYAPMPPNFAPTVPATNNWPPAQKAWNDIAQGAPPGGQPGQPQQGPMPQPNPTGAPAAPANVPNPQVMINPHQGGAPVAQVASAQPPVAQQPAAPAPAPAAAPQIPAGNPPLGVEGYCPVTLIKEKKWIRGDVRHGAIHRGRTYLFTTKEKQEEFLKTPDQFSPMLSGFDPVKYAEQGLLIPGSRRHGLFYGKQIYLFADEDAVNRFNANPANYTSVVREAMVQSGNDTLRR